ncbi:MAG: radical SAM protein, partial [Candidatus Hydrothermarchaeaceae archaeon]
MYNIFDDSSTFLDVLKKADGVTRKNHNFVTLERAILLSWWCDKSDCKFCHMSTQNIESSEKAKRKPWSILAEAELIDRVGWDVEFLSSGYGAYNLSEIRELTEMIAHVTERPQWLNVGVLNEKEMQFGDEVGGIIGSVETVSKIRKQICPSKPLGPIKKMLKEAKESGLKTGITIVLGLGEGIEDIPVLLNLIGELNIDRITLYSLNPHDGTALGDSPPPASIYQAGVIALTRLEFPKIHIIGGTWIDQLPNIGLMLLAGANGITKYPVFTMFGNRHGKKVEEEVKFTNRKLLGTFTDMDILTGKKALEKERDPKFVFGYRRPEISEAVKEKLERFEDRKKEMVESYIREVSKALSPGGRI